MIVNVCYEGVRPSRPTCHECSDELWDLLKTCWASAGGSRPSIASAKTKLETLSAAFRPLRLLSIGNSHYVLS